MNNSEQITVSLEWAKKLKEAGWNQDGRGGFKFGYFDYEGNPYPVLANWDTDIDKRIAVAPTAEEILRELPMALPDEFGICSLEVRKTEDGYMIHYFSHEDGKSAYLTDKKSVFSDAALSDCVAKMYCHLAENKLLPTDDEHSYVPKNGETFAITKEMEETNKFKDSYTPPQ